MVGDFPLDTICYSCFSRAFLQLLKNEQHTQMTNNLIKSTVECWIEKYESSPHLFVSQMQFVNLFYWLCKLKYNIHFLEVLIKY